MESSAYGIMSALKKFRFGVFGSGMGNLCLQAVNHFLLFVSSRMSFSYDSISSGCVGVPLQCQHLGEGGRRSSKETLLTTTRHDILRAGGVAQLGECLPSMPENPST